MRRNASAALWALVCVSLLVGCPSAEVQVKEDPKPVEAPKGPQKPSYPASRTVDVKDNYFGQEIADPYRWLEDGKDAEVQGWMKEQDAFTRAELAKLPNRAKLEARLKELFYVDALSAPQKKGSRYFLQRRHADREKAVVYWKEGEKGEEKVLLDPNAMSQGGKNVSLGGWEVSHDGKRVAYKLKENNADESTLYVMEVETGKVSDVDVIPGAKYASPEWTPSGDGFYYTWLPTDANIPTDERPGHADVRFHKLGTDPKTDALIHARTNDPTKFIGASLSRDGRWLFRYIYRGWAEVDIALRDLKAKDTRFKPFYAPKDALAYVLPWKDQFYIVTNEGAPNYQVFKTAANKPDRKHWKLLIPERKDAVVDTVQVIGEHLVMTLIKDASNTMEVYDLKGKKVRDVPLPALGSTFGMTGNPDEDDAYFAFASFTTPRQVYRTSIKGGQTSLWSEVKVPVDPSPYTVEQAWVTSKDGTKVPMFLVHRKDVPKDGSTPWILDGYGGFSVSLTPYFRASLYPWLEAGGGYALANLRGGGEFGEDWHRAGMLTKKQNVFDDFFAAAQHLIDQKYTSPSKLAISGGSNGGLLVGAAMTQKPELFGAVVCSVPLLDMLRYHKFGSGKTWIAEYGSSDDADQYKALLSYSPYHHVKPGVEYPATLFLSADNDDRVDPLHARKMAAALQTYTKGTAPILLRIEAQAGHGGADLVKEQVAENVDMYSFLMARFGMTLK